MTFRKPAFMSCSDTVIARGRPRAFVGMNVVLPVPRRPWPRRTRIRYVCQPAIMAMFCCVVAMRSGGTTPPTCK